MANPQQQDPDFIPAEQSPDFIPANSGGASFDPGNIELSKQGLSATPPGPPKNPIEQAGVVTRAVDALGAKMTPQPTNSKPFSMERLHEQFGTMDNPRVPVSSPSEFAGDIGSSFKRLGEDIPGGIGELSAIPLQVLASHRLGQSLGPPQPTPKAIPVEESARTITKAINPPVQDWNNFIGNVTEQGGNIKSFGQKNNNPFKTQMDFANAARGMADEAKAHWDKVIGPYESEQLSVAGSGYQGRTVGEGQRATLGDILDRIDVINNELRPAFNKREVGQTLTALQQAELNHELASLKATVNDTLGAKTGLNADQITALRKRYGGGYSIADQTTAAWNQRQSSAGKADEGRRDVPLTTASWLAEGINKIRGGAEGIGNRNFRKAFEPAQFSANDLPIPSAPSFKPPSREPLWKKAGAEPSRPSDFFTEENEAPKQRRLGK